MRDPHSDHHEVFSTPENVSNPLHFLSASLQYVALLDMRRKEFCAASDSLRGLRGGVGGGRWEIIYLAHAGSARS